MSSLLVEQYMAELEAFLSRHTKEQVMNTDIMAPIMHVQSPMIRALHLIAIKEGLTAQLHASFIEMFRMIDPDLTDDDIKDLFARTLGYKDHEQAVAFKKNAAMLINRRYITHH